MHRGKSIDEGTLWERDDEVYRVEKVYEAKRLTEAGYTPITLVKVVCVEPAPRHTNVEKFLELYEPYDPDAD